MFAIGTNLSIFFKRLLKLICMFVNYLNH